MRALPNAFLAVFIVLSGWFRGVAQAQEPAPGQRWTYRLMEGSQFTQDSLVGGPPTITRALRGTFELAYGSANPLYTTYILTDINLTTDSNPDSAYRVAGSGTCQLGGEVAISQDVRLDTVVGYPGGSVPKQFTNQVGAVIRKWPVLEVELAQADANLVVFYRLRLVAAPAREIWFSTRSGLTSGNQNAPTNHYSGGDLLSLSGRAVKRNGSLAARLGIMPPVPDLGLAAIDIEAGGESWFAFGEAVFSETLGPIQQGDVVSDRGRIVWRNQELLAAFGVNAKAPDRGLDALWKSATGEVFFSIRTNIWSSTLGGTLSRGDVLSSQGRILKSNKELLSRFQPTEPGVDYGLDALHIWPSGEIWFSVEDGFLDRSLGVVTAGDMISDDGYVVIKNLEMVGAFQPLEDLADFGLDAIYLVSDITSPGVAPGMSKPIPGSGLGDLVLQWEGTGRLFQVERADAVVGAYQAVSPILIDRTFIDAGVTQAKPHAFYRLRQW